jgi:hypothetical protein
MDEHVGSALTGDEAEALLAVEELHGALHIGIYSRFE